MTAFNDVINKRNECMTKHFHLHYCSVCAFLISEEDKQKIALFSCGHMCHMSCFDSKKRQCTECNEIVNKFTYCHLKTIHNYTRPTSQSNEKIVIRINNKVRII